MDQKEMSVSQPAKEELTPAVRGPVELDPALFGFVSGGLPLTGWSSTNAAATSTRTS